jgi:pimeloyl-ACP methyl ester carboxylesterase
MMAETHFTIVPTDAIQQIVAWCCAHCEAPRPARLSGASASEPRSQTRITARQYLAGDTAGADAQTVAEYLLRFGEQQTLFGIVSQPQVSDWRQHPTIILLNSGSVHHIGPHRLYVFLARHFAQLGFRCLRMDFAGLGDSVIDDVAHENHPYTKTATRDTAQAIAALKREQPQTDFMLMGLCSGAYAAFHASIAIPNERIIESVLINPLTFYWKEGMSLAIPSEAHYRQWNDYMVSMRKWDKWLKLLRGGVSIAEIISTLRERFQILVSVKYKELKKKFAPTATVGSPQRDLSEDLHTIVKQGRQISFVFSENDPGYGLLITNAKGMVNKLKRQHKLDIQFISKADHTFSKSAARAVVMEKLTGILTGRYLN